jgi:hypothetical protein
MKIAHMGIALVIAPVHSVIRLRGGARRILITKSQVSSLREDTRINLVSAATLKERAKRLYRLMSLHLGVMGVILKVFTEANLAVLIVLNVIRALTRGRSLSLIIAVAVLS